MCGIAGFVRAAFPGAGRDLLARMGDALWHRGPDAGGHYWDDHVGLVHRRLSIIDLSPLGNQPMASADGRLQIVFNGEIYNYREIRRELEAAGSIFRTRTDTEVLLELYRQQGAACLKNLNGMFAFAVWDSLARTLFLARDRMGKKPLYYYHTHGDGIAFASELKALLQLPGVDRIVEPTALADYFKYQYIPAPKTVFQHIHKLLPAHSLTLSLGGEPVVGEYWDLDVSRRVSCTQDEAEDELLDLLRHSTACRMVADVPLGAFLSGGVDSSAIVALMAKLSPQPVTTCTIGFSDRRHDETPHARQVARLFATDHREFTVANELAETVAVLPHYFDEPFADASALPTYHVSRLARQAVTVALAGDGGDESFGGYEKYGIELMEDLVRSYVPRPLLAAVLAGCGDWRHTVARRARSLAGSALLEPGRAFYRTNTCIGDDLLERLLAPKVHRACSGYDPAEATLRHWDRTQGADHVTRMLYTDLKSYLPDDILVKVDRMSMAHSLEVRAPFLDYRIVEFAAALPSEWKITLRSKKIILRKAVSRLLPPTVLDRPKHGFTVPLDAWFRHDLKELFGSMVLQSDALAEFLDPGTVATLWDEHQYNRADHGMLLWSILMLALWQREYLPS